MGLSRFALEAFGGRLANGVFEHRLHTLEVLLLVQGGGVARVAVCNGDRVADAGDWHDDRVLAGDEVGLLHEARETVCLRSPAHSHALKAGPVDLQPVAGTLKVRACVAHTVSDVHAIDGCVGEDGVHERIADHAVRVGERCSIHGGGEVLHEVCDDNKIACVDVIAHPTSCRREDELANAQLPEDPHQEVHRVAVAFIHVDTTGNYEHTLPTDDCDADFAGVARNIGERREALVDFRECNAPEELDGLSPSGSQNGGDVRIDVPNRGHQGGGTRLCPVVELIVSVCRRHGYSIEPERLYRKYSIHAKQNTSGEAGVCKIAKGKT